MSDYSEAFNSVWESPIKWFDEDENYPVCRDAELLGLTPPTRKFVDMPYVGRIGDAFVSGHQRYAAVRSADVHWTIYDFDDFAWRVPERPDFLPSRMSHHASIAFGSREDAEAAIGLEDIELAGKISSMRPRDCMVYFPIDSPTFSGSIFLDRDAAAADARVFALTKGRTFGEAGEDDLRELSTPALQVGDAVHTSLMETWKRTGSIVKASADAGLSISVTAAALVLSEDIEARDPRIEGLKHASEERVGFDRMEDAHQAHDPVGALRALRETLPEEREVQIKAAAAIMALDSGLKSGNRDHITLSLAAAETLVDESKRPDLAMEGLVSASAGARRFYEKPVSDRTATTGLDRRGGDSYGRD